MKYLDSFFLSFGSFNLSQLKQVSVSNNPIFKIWLFITASQIALRCEINWLCLKSNYTQLFAIQFAYWKKKSGKQLKMSRDAAFNQDRFTKRETDARLPANFWYRRKPRVLPLPFKWCLKIEKSLLAIICQLFSHYRMAWNLKGNTEWHCNLLNAGENMELSKLFDYVGFPSNQEERWSFIKIATFSSIFRGLHVVQCNAFL